MIRSWVGLGNAVPESSIPQARVIPVVRSSVLPMFVPPA